MDFKLLKMRWQLAFFRLTGRLGKIPEKVQFPLSQAPQLPVLFCMPRNPQTFKVAAFHLRTILKDPDRTTFFLVQNNYRHLLSLHGEKVWFYRTEDGKIKSDDKEHIILQMRSHRWRAIVDLNAQFDLDQAMLISQIPAPLKIGFQSEFSDHFYNLQFGVTQAGILEKSYEQILQILEIT